MIDVISTNAAAGAATLHAAALSLGWNVSTGQIEAAGAAVVLLTRYAHLEAPKVWNGMKALGKAAYAAGCWAEQQGGLRTIWARLMGPKGVAAPLRSEATQGGQPAPVATAHQTPVMNIPLNSSMN